MRGQRGKLQGRRTPRLPACCATEYKAKNITVGAINIDSLWCVPPRVAPSRPTPARRAPPAPRLRRATGTNNFIVDTAKFPDMKTVIAGMHAQGIRVIFWTTSMIDTDSSNFNASIAQQAYVRNAVDNTPSPLKWWHGEGLLLDYAHTPSREWWERQLDQVLSLGLDGWKVDGTDPYVLEYLAPRSWNTSACHDGVYSYRDYADAYYGHFFNYTYAYTGGDSIIWSRPVDSYPLLSWPGPGNASDSSTEGISAYLHFSPHYVMFSGWVGDQDPDFNGLRDALRNIIHSAWAGYTNFGSDTGGYRTGPGPLGRTGELLLRWAAVNAFLPLFENGGDKEHRPWKFDAPGSTLHVDAYRVLVAAHYELEPYLYSLGHTAYAAGVSAIAPNQAPLAPYPFILQGNTIHDYAFMLGPDYFVVPVVHAGARTVTASFPGPAQVAALATLPAGEDVSDVAWVSLWDPTLVVAGGTNATLNTSYIGNVPVFRRANALTPLHVSTPLLGHGDAASASALTLTAHLLPTPALQAGFTTRTVVKTWKARGTQAELKVSPPDAAGRVNATLLLSAWSRADLDTVLLLRGVAPTADTRVVGTHANAQRGQRAASTTAIPRQPATLLASATTRLATGVDQRARQSSLPLTSAQADVASPYIGYGFDPQAPSMTVHGAAPQPYWAAAGAQDSAAGVPEVLVRAGDASLGLQVTLTHLRIG